MGGLWFFIADTDVSRGYSIDLGLQICIFDTKAKTLNMIARRISDIKSIDPTVVQQYQQYAINRKNNRSKFNRLKKGTYIWTKSSQDVILV